MEHTGVGKTRKRALLAVAPFVLLGFMSVGMLLLWGPNPLWAVMVLPPILFVSVLAWIAFRSGFTHSRTESRSSAHDNGGK